MRFIPTCVGQMYEHQLDTYSLTGSSPRAWGRCIIVRVDALNEGGSSPRAWGRLDVDRTWLASHRFIPTCVGQIDQAPLLQAVARGSSPRAWGRCMASGMWRLSVPGSSPRAWGRLLEGVALFPLARFIPTCVGQIPAARCICPCLPVHPHVRGADGNRAGHEAADDRFIPTCVGQIFSDVNTTGYPSGSSPRAWGRFRGCRLFGCHVTVHPHVRGADEAPPEWLGEQFGSSPRAWGRLPGLKKVLRDLRFIPTCVGQIVAYFTAKLEEYGSSPRAWVIPTCVGQMRGF